MRSKHISNETHHQVERHLTRADRFCHNPQELQLLRRQGSIEGQISDGFNTS